MNIWEAAVFLPYNFPIINKSNLLNCQFSSTFRISETVTLPFREFKSQLPGQAVPVEVLGPE